MQIKNEDEDNIPPLGMRTDTVSMHALVNDITRNRSNSIVLLCDGSLSELREWGIGVCTQCNREQWYSGGIGEQLPFLHSNGFLDAGIAETLSIILALIVACWLGNNGTVLYIITDRMCTLASLIKRKQAKPCFYIALCLLQELLNEACSNYRYVHFVHKRVLHYQDGWPPDGLANHSRKRCLEQSKGDMRVLEMLQKKITDLVKRKDLEDLVKRNDDLRMDIDSQLQLLHPTYSDKQHLFGIAFARIRPQAMGANAESVD